MNDRNEHKVISYLDIIIVVLSVYVIAALLIDSFFKLPDQVSRLLYLIDNAICIVFLYDFTYRLIKAPSKLEFMKWGWIDLISSIPTFEYLRYGRLIRLFRLLRVLRAFRSVKHIAKHILKNRTKGTFATVSVIAALMLIFGSIAILEFEQAPKSNIKSAEDAIWWAFITISTVGYGDKYPVTTEGRIVAAFLMITGVGLFGTFTGYVTAWFIGTDKSKEEEKK
ncbi:MAG: ion transporter [Bacteroidia bacterium]|nr:ion transporter [Bacteroidia bacterium]